MPYVLHLLTALPDRNKWVISRSTSANGYLTCTNTPHSRLQNYEPGGLHLAWAAQLVR